MDAFEIEIIQEFSNEAFGLLKDMERIALLMEKGECDPSSLDQMFRAAHNLKGTSKALGFDQISELTHHLENLFTQLKKGEVKVTQHSMDVVLAALDFLERMLSALSSNPGEVFDLAAVLKDLERLACQQEIGPSTPEDQTPVADQFEAEVVPLHPIQQELQKIDQAVDEWQPPAASVTALAPKISQEKVAPPPSHKTLQDTSIRVNLSRLEKLNNYVGELVILQSMLGEERAIVENGKIMKTVGHLGKIAKEIQEISMSLRMVPIKSVLMKLERVVRDTSKLLNKDVDLVIRGEETEVDKSVAEYLGDPLVHLVRNAVDHGLEDPAKRLASGKSLKGTVNIHAYHEGNQLVVEIQDDGGGIDHQLIERKAKEKGLIPEKHNMGRAELVDLVFHPGFSTKDHATSISGRGVGMDVVRNNIKNLNGEVQVETTIGIGTTFRIRLPLTLAIIDGLIVEVLGRRFVVPLIMVKEFFVVTQEMIQNVHGRGEFINLRGDILPIYRLQKDMLAGWQLAKGHRQEARQIAVVVSQGKLTFAVMVDDIVSQQQVVVKQVGKEIRDQQGFMGATILGDGRPAFILDILGYYTPYLKEQKLAA